MSNSRSVRRQRKQPWNKGLALTSTPSLGTTRRWVQAAVDQGTVERKGVERTGKAGRPAVLYGLTEAALERAKKERGPTLEMHMEQVRRWENIRRRRKMQQATQRLNAQQQKAAKAGRKLKAATDALEQKEAELVTAEVVIHATRELISAGGDASVLLPEEIGALTETGCMAEEDGRLVVAEDWLAAYRRIFSDNQVHALP